MGTIVEFKGVKIRVNPRDHLPPHVHVIGNGGIARFNLETLEWMESREFSRSDLRAIEEVISEYLEELWAEWRRCHEK